jgi:hypothetical protein
MKKLRVAFRNCANAPINYEFVDVDLTHLIKNLTKRWALAIAIKNFRVRYNADSLTPQATLAF